MVGIYGKILLICLILASFLVYIPVLLRGEQLNIAQFIGLFGLQLIIWQIILGERQINKLFTDDLQWINKIHKFMGKYGFLIILIHPILMNLSYGLNPLSLNLEGQFNFGVFLGKVAISILAIVWFVSAILRNKISWRWWKRIHIAAYLILPILLLHAFRIGGDLATPGFIRFWISLMGVVYLLAILIKLLDWSGLLKTSYKVVNKSEVAKDVMRFQLRPVGESIKPKRGQFAYLQSKRFGEAHPFTISHFDKKTGEISFSIKSVGPYSSKLRNLDTKDIVFVDGPFGTFTRDIYHQKRPMVMIAGGIGITPFVRWLQAKKVDYLFYGARTEEDLAYKHIITSSRAKYVKVLSEPPADQKPGFITTSLLERQLKNLSKYNFYICGPPIMMDKLIDDLKISGVPKSQIHFEKFSL